MTQISLTRRLASAAVFAVALCGCSSDPRQGYSFSQTHTADIDSVHVPIFENSTFSQGLEIQLTDAVIKEIQRSTPWRITDSDDADATLSGAIVASDLRKLSTARTSGLVQEMAVEVSIDFDLKDNRTGQMIASRRSLSAAESFVPATGVSERIEVGRHAVVQELAKEIVAAFRSNW